MRVLRVTPTNPMILCDEDRRAIAGGFARLLTRLRPGQSLQLYIDARPVRLADVLAHAQAEVEATAGRAPTRDHPARDATALSRWRLYTAMEETLRRHADAQAAVEVNAYAIVPCVPRRAGARATIRRTFIQDAPLERDAHAHRRAVRESQAHVDTVRAELEAVGFPVRQLNGAELFALLWARLNPTSADSVRRPRPVPVEILGELDARQDREQAIAAARELRAALARSSVDLKRGRHLVEIERDVEQVIYARTTAQHTGLGWLLGAMLTRQPYTLSVHVHALDRRRERQRIKLGYRRLFAINRGAEQRGRVPDFDRYAQEREYEQLLGQMAGQERANLYDVSIYQALRAPGPVPDLTGLAEAVDGCAEAIESAADCKVDRGEFRQRELWTSTLPLGRDSARRTRRYATGNAADTLPLTGTGCGSPDGIPFAFADPGHTLERLDPYDPEHQNHTLVIAGRSGSGKTMTANILLARSIALGARAFVIDRAGHYEPLTRLIAGARHIELGTDSPFALNPWDVPDPANVPREKLAFLLSLHTVMMGDEGLGKTEVAQLGEAIRAVYARAAVFETARPRESMLREELLAMARHHQRDGAGELAALARNLAVRLSEWCGDGTYAYLLDRETTVADRQPAGRVRHAPLPAGRPGARDVLDHGVRHRLRRAALGSAPGLRRPGRTAIRGPLDHADRRGLASGAPRRDRRVRERSRAARPPSRAGARRAVPAALAGRHRARARAAPERHAAAAARAAPERAGVHAAGAAALRRGTRDRRTPGDRQGQPRADAVDQRHPRTRPGRDAGRPDRVLGVHVRPGPRRRPPRSGAARTRRRQLGRGRGARPGRRRPGQCRSVGMTRTWPAPRAASGPAPAGTSARRQAPVMPVRAPLLAVCGLCGGAGASTLTYLVARYAIERGLGHVLAFDTGGTTGGLSAICGVETQLTLGDVAECVRRGVPLASMYARVPLPTDDELQLRVIAAAPRLDDHGSGASLPALLDQARTDDAHALLVADCGTLARADDRRLLAAASHVAWVLPATGSGETRARRVLEMLPAEPDRHELVVARRGARDSAAELHALAELAAVRRAALVLVPELPDAGRVARRRAGTSAARAGGHHRRGGAVSTLAQRPARPLVAALALTALVAAVAIVVRVACAAQARELLGYRFGGVAREPASALSILAHNAQILLAILVAAALVQTPWVRAHAPARRRPSAQFVVSMVDTYLVLALAFNVLVVGGALGAYGERMVRAVLPHGPLEALAFAAALDLYLRGRAGRLTGARVAGTALAATVALAVAAGLETYVVL